MRNVGFLVLVPVALLSVSCAPPEQGVIETFINAAQSGNDDAVATVSVVKFPGKVTSWEFVELGPESTAPFGLADLYEEVGTLKEDLDAMVANNDAFLRENEETYLKYKPMVDKDPDQEFKGKLGEFHEEWSARMKEQTSLDEKIKETEDAIDALKKEAGLSINTPGMSSHYDGDVKTKEARVKVDGKDYTLTLKQYSLVNTENNIEPMSRWIVAGVDEAS
jgi:predicted nuclease with TOPRIM domain